MKDEEQQLHSLIEQARLQGRAQADADEKEIAIWSWVGPLVVFALVWAWTGRLELALFLCIGAAPLVGVVVLLAYFVRLVVGQMLARSSD